MIERKISNSNSSDYSVIHQGLILELYGGSWNVHPHWPDWLTKQTWYRWLERTGVDWNGSQLLQTQTDQGQSQLLRRTSLFHSILLLYLLLYCSDVTCFCFSPSCFFPCDNSEKMEKKNIKQMKCVFIWHDMQWTKEAPAPVCLGLSSAFIDRPPWNYRLRTGPLLRCGFWLFFISFLLSFFLFFPPLFGPPPPPAVGALPWDRDLLMYDRYGWLWVDQSRSSRWMAPVKPFIRLRAEAFQKGPDMEEMGIPSWLFLYSPQCVCEGLFWRGRLTLPHVKLSNKDETGSRMNSVHAVPSRP